ncbi:hypothetical protein NUH88_05515 [Nisaea acidiphila]|uniref:Uncharacterized protein n=1 Tax=Nisaea acidiphila TaxID=1862145 RepID=A0A9J7ATV9_9PROT|nr:hypothetical protein [Nisaea acidiphila]UUX51147.1 hypothetical protein NUH88_05515 [Nisaea acidiphila]
MDRDSPPNWNFFGTVERLIKATESLLDQHAGHGGVDCDLARNMITRLTVIMEDAAIYTTREDKERRDALEARLKSIRDRLDVVDKPSERIRAERLMLGGNRTQFGRVPV